MKIDKRSEESVYITINGWVYYIDDSTDEQIMDKWREGSERESEPAFDVETRRAREEMEAGNEKTEYPFGEGETP